MKIPDKIIQKYNQKSTLLFISTYPKKGGIYNSQDVGGTAYVKNTILALRKNNPSQRIVVLATCLDQADDYSYYVEDGALIIRCFKRGSLASFINLFKNVKLFTQVPVVLFQLEFASYGEIQSILFLPFLFASFLLIRKRIVLILHQVVMDLATLSGHIGVTGFKLKIFSWGLRLYYRIFGMLTQSIIVLEDQIKERLGKLVNPDKIHVVYHGVDAELSFNKISQIEARNQLDIKNDEFVILCFGYVTWYKGTDFLAQALKDIKAVGNKKLRVIFAGGETPTQAHKKHYQRFFKRVQFFVDGADHMQMTGFLPEKDIATYISASDLAVVPFRTFKSSSGSLAAIYAFEKPFIVSSVLSGYFQSRDMKGLLHRLGMSFKDISFDLNKKSLHFAIENAMQKKNYTKLTKLSQGIKTQRDFGVLAKQYDLVLNKNKANEHSFIPAKKILFKI